MKSNTPFIPLSAALALSVVCLFLAGCQSQDTTAAFQQSQDQALKDPMNYSPNMDNTDITGGGIGNFDGKAMKQDWDDFWNP